MIFSNLHKKLIKYIGLPMFSMLLSTAITPAQAAPVGILDLSDKPLYLSTGETKPSLVLALSVEFPTVGAAYLDATYVPTREYLGYFNHNLCYNYITASQYFVPVKQASAGHQCGGDSFSGNLMNFATASAIDTLRYSLTGGDRFIDTPTQTVLQRALIRTNFYNSGNFPRKQLSAAHAQQALPLAARTNRNGSVHNGIVYISNCLENMFITSNGGGSCNQNQTGNHMLGTSLTSASGSMTAFKVRVEVCPNSGSVSDDRSVGATGQKLCMQYPSGNEKPVGLLQRNSTELRVAAFGYPFNADNSLYAGIMRAPMKYLGPVAFDSDYKQIPGNNPKAEWNPTTGVFISNPENYGSVPGRSTPTISGVINYLNQFGRTGVQGDYKTYDQATHLYYESLRYLQGLPPTPKAIDALNRNPTASYDGYPAYTTWDDPHPAINGLGHTGDYSCYENNILFIGDKNTHYENHIPGDGNRNSSPSLANNEPNFVHWRNVIQAFERNTSSSYIDDDNIVRPTTGNPTVQGSTYVNNLGAKAYLAGMAYWANTHDIRGSNWTNNLAAQRPGMKVKSYFIDVNETGGSNTVGQRYSNQYFYAAKYGGFDRNKSQGGNPFIFKDGTNAGNTLWQRDTANNFPNTYFLASDVQAVLTALENIFSNIVASSTNIGGVAISSGTNTAKIGDKVYLAHIDAYSWAGDIQQYTLVKNGNTIDTVKSSSFSVEGTLGARDWQTRNILTTNDGKTAVTFKWSSLDSNYQAALATDADATLAQDRLEFIAGNRALENTSFRLRSSVMGDIINSVVTYKGAPSIKGISSYLTFYEANKNRPHVLYAGANDGMLHAFDVNSQEELFAYIPSFVVPNLYKLTTTTYEHESYVDGPMDIQEVYANGWKTALVGSGGAGGQGIYALNVTAPDAVDASNVLLWEFTDKDDASLGNVLGKPVIFNKNDMASQPHGRWFAAFPSGVNSQVNDGAKSSDGKSYIFIVNMDKGAQMWTQIMPGSTVGNYYKIPVGTASNSAAEITSINIVKVNGIHYIYAGDLAGQVWKVTLPSNVQDWPTATSTLLFKTQANQPITAPVTVSTGNGGVYVSFGTGKLLEYTDTQPAYHTQSLYTILDAGREVNLSDLVRGTQQNDGTISIGSFTWHTPAVANPSSKYGWYLNMKDSNRSGERVTQKMTLDNNGYLHVNTLTPSIGHCESGYSISYQINLRTGAGAYQTSDKLLGAFFLIQGELIHTVDEDGNPVDSYENHTGSVGGDGSINISDGTYFGMRTGILSSKELPEYNALRKELNP